MSTPIRISEREYEIAKKVAQLEHRTIQGQVEYWAKVGRCALDNPDLPINMIKELLLTDWNDRSDATPFDFEEK